MPRKFSEKYILSLNDAKSYSEIGQEGYERKKILHAGLKSPRMLFILENAFRDFISYIGYQKELIRGFSFDEIQHLSSEILERDLPLEVQESIEGEYLEWRVKDRNVLMEIRLSNKDLKQNYIEEVRPVVIKDFNQLLTEIKKCWIEALDEYKEGVIVQITEIPTYDVSGFVYINRDAGSIEINALYGLWINGERFSHYDVCIADYETLEINNYSIGEQTTMLVKNEKELIEVPVADTWIKNYKLTQSQLKKVLSKSKEMAESFNRSIEYSFGILKSHIFIHDLRDYKNEFLGEEYLFANDFFLDQSEKNFQNEVDAIANIELPFFLREDISTIESNIEKNSQKNLFIGRLKKDLITFGRQKRRDYRKIDNLNELFHEESDYKGFLIEFEIFLKTINNLDKSSPEKIYSILSHSLKSIENYFRSLSDLEKEVILKLSSLGNKQEEDKNPHYFTKTLDLVPLRKLGLEILIFKKLLEEQSFSSLSLSLPPLRSCEEMEFVLSILNLSDFRGIRNDSAKLYVDLSIPSMLFEYSREDLPKKYLLDGVIVDLNEFMKNFFNKKVFTERDYKIAINYLEQNLNSVKNQIAFNMLVVREIPESQEVVSKLRPDIVIVDPE